MFVAPNFLSIKEKSSVYFYDVQSSTKQQFKNGIRFFARYYIKSKK